MALLEQTESERLFAENAQLRREIRFSRVRVLAGLVVGTVVLALWRMAWFEKTVGSSMGITITMMPVFVNLLAWTTWTAAIYMSLIRFSARRTSWSGGPHDALREYESTISTLQRQRRMEQMFDLLLGLQFIGMLLGVLYMMLYVATRVNRPPVIS